MQICREPIRGAFVERPNRFTATIKVSKKDVFAYIPSSARIESMCCAGASMGRGFAGRASDSHRSGEMVSIPESLRRPESISNVFCGSAPNISKRP